MPWIGAAIAGGVGIVGDIMSQQGQQQTNAMSMAMMQENQQWQENMRDTAMQARVSDLKMAGLNPLLATGTPGASMVSPVMPNLQNPGASFSQLGSQASSAIGLQTQQSQIDLMKAQATKLGVESGVEIPAQVAKISSEIGVNQSRAQEINRNIQMLDIQLQKWGSGPEASSLYETNLQNRNALQALQVSLAQMDVQERNDTLLTLIKARNDTNFAASIGARNIASASDTAFGRIMAYFNLGKPAVSTAVGAARVAGELIP